MKSILTDLIEKIHALEFELEQEIKAKQASFPFQRVGRKIRFETLLRQYHKAQKTGLFRYLRETDLATYLTAPAIYSIIVPIVVSDLFFSIYQRICFPAYGIPLVNRSDYILVDRHHLSYLNVIEKFNCIYCGYANGTIAYVQEIASRTEQYWCPIKHAGKVVAAHKRYIHFLEYGDADGYRGKLEEIRSDVRAGHHSKQNPTEKDNDRSDG